MTTTRAAQLQQHIDSFPVLPITVSRLIKVTSDPESSASDVMEAITPDQSLCLTVLKIANSVLFGRPKKVDSIIMAVTVLGFNEVQRIALTKAVINSFHKLAVQHKKYIDKHWIHAFVCGMTAKVIARDLRIAPDIAFMGGLIHDIGKLIMLETFYDEYAVEDWMTRFSNGAMLHDELAMFSFTHDFVGAQLLKQWLFPDTLITAVANHHRPVGAGDETGLALIIQIADILSFYCCNQESLEEYEGDIIAAVDAALPELRYHWKEFGLILEDDEVCRWFSWLTSNYEQGSRLKDAFST